MKTPKLSFRLVLGYLLLLGAAVFSTSTALAATASAGPVDVQAEDTLNETPELWIAGLALDSDRDAVADARVELRALLPTGTSWPTVHGTTDDRGRFALPAPAVGVYALTVSAPGRVPVVYEPLPVVERRRLTAAVLPMAERSEIVMLPADGRSGAGAVADGLWIEAVSTHLAPPLELHGWRPANRKASIGPDGRAEVPRLPGELLDLMLLRADGKESGIEIERRSGVTRASFSLPHAVPIALHKDPGLTPAVGVDRRIHGRVFDGDSNRPLAGALVWSRDEPGRFTRTDVDGRFKLVTTPGNTLRALAPGFLAADGTTKIQATNQTKDQEPVVLRPTRTRAGFGQVLDLDEHPLAGVLVTVRAAEDRRTARSPFMHTRTDADGRFTIDALPAPVVDLRARHPDFVATVVRGIDTVTNADDPDAVVDLGFGRQGVDLGTLLLAPGAPLHGRVVDEAGRPVAEVSVWASKDLQTPEPVLGDRPPSNAPDAITDASGVFTVTGTAAGDRRRLLLRAEGYLPRAVGAVPAGNSPDRPLEVVLQRGAVVTGRVVDEQGTPIADANLSAEPVISFDQPTLPGPESYASTHTDEHGIFRFSALTPRAYVLSAEAPDFRPPEPQTLELGNLEPDEVPPEVVFIVERGAVLHGRITNDRDEAVADARVLVAQVAGRTDAEGRFRIGGVAPGQWQTRILHPAYRVAERTVEILERQEHVLDVQLPAGQRVFGRTVDVEGLPVPGVDLIFELEDHDEPARRRAASDAEGFFELADIPDGSYRVFTERRGFATSERPAALRVDGEPVHDLEVVLEPGTLVEGEILGLDFDQLATVRVRAQPESGPPLDGRVSHDGHFTLDDLGSGSWLLTAELPDAARQARARLQIGPGERRLARDLRFDGGELLAEILLDGEPLADAEVSLEGRDLALTRSTFTDHQGQLHFSDLVPGRYRLHVSYPRRWVSHSRELTVDNGSRSVRVEIESLVLEGSVRSADSGEAVANARVGLLLLAATGDAPVTDDPMSLFSVTSDENGRFHVPRLSAGRYRLEVRRQGFADHEEELELRPGAPERTVDMRPTPGFELRLVEGQDGLPPWVSARFQSADGRLISDSGPVSDGAVRFSSLPPGVWNAWLSAPGRVTVERTVEVPGHLEVSLPASAALRIHVPALAESDALAGVRLLAPDGRPAPVTSEPAGPAHEHPMIAGAAQLGGVAAGPWTIEVTAADGRVWRTAVVAEAAREHQVFVE